MPYDPEKPHRRSIRLQGYDYRQPGAYFIPIVTQNRACLFGEVVDGAMRLNEWGKIIREEWFRSAEIRREIKLLPDELVVMPNHIHGIVWIVDGDNDVSETVRAHGRAPLRRATAPTPFVGSIHRRFQIRRHQTRQPTPRHAWCPCLATQLLRTHHSQRGIIAMHSAIHYRKSLALAFGP